MVGISGITRRIAAAVALCALAAPFFGTAPSVASSPGTQGATVAALCPAATPGTAQCFALRRTDIAARPASAVSPLSLPAGYGPADLRSAYALPSGSAGSGLTVAIVDAYDLPTAEADLQIYRDLYGLPPCTTLNGCFKKVNQNGATSPLPVRNASWAGEIALDMDMVSATCPNCKILLVEATTSSLDDLGPAVNTAVSLGAIAVSNSYGVYEWSAYETSYDSYYNHPGVAITVSTGDCGYHCSGVPGNYHDSVEYPSASPYVVAVGGTSLTHSASARGWSESAWGNAPNTQGAGSGCSAYEPKPSWQHDTGCANRTQADVSAVADPATGVAIYSVDSTVGGWNVYGGTSAASPIIAAVYALAGAPAAGTYPASYPYGDTADLNDVTSGSNDVWGSQLSVSCAATSHPYFCNGVVGYDGPTGLGTPNGTGAFTAPIAPGGATKLVVSGLTTPRTAGSTGSIRVTALDASGNRVHSYLGTVKFSSSDPQAKLPANYAFTAADAGTHVFSGAVILKTAGTQSVTATDTKTATIKGSQAGIVVNAAALSKLVVSGMTTPRTAGTTGNIRVTATDAYGNRIHSYLGTVKFSSSDPQAKLPANYKFTAADNGTHVFSGTVILKTAGTQSVTATDTLTKTIKGSQAGIVVKAAAVKTLVVSGLTTPRTKGVAGSIRVTAVDAYGNRVSSYRGTVHFTSSDAKAKLPANYKFTATDNGTHVFVGTVILKTAGTQWVRARDTVTSTITGVQYGIVVK